MNKPLFTIVLLWLLALAQISSAQANNPAGNPAAKSNQLVHVSPTMSDLESADMHPELKRVIRRGYSLFMDTQQLRGKNVFNSMNCNSCHLGEGRLPFAGPLWPAAVTLPNYRGKNNYVNNLEDRIAGCFTYSMNGISPDYGSDDMVALTSYIRWLAKGAPVFPDNKELYGRGYPKLAKPDLAADYDRGQQAFTENCSICHGDQGQGLVQKGEVIFPALWGDAAYNWGAGIVRLHTLAAFIRYNMPLGQPNSMTVQQSWDLAYYINSQERPQDPRYLGDVKKTRAKYDKSFHQFSHYGLNIRGKLLGDHSNTGEKPVLKPKTMKSRTFQAD